MLAFAPAQGQAGSVGPIDAQTILSFRILNRYAIEGVYVFERAETTKVKSVQIHSKETRLDLRAPGPQDGAVEDEELPDGDLLSEIEEIDLEPLLTQPSVARNDDTELVHGIQQGDMAAFEALFHKYQNAIYRTSLAITRDPGAAEEVLQDCFYKTYLNIMKITGEGSLSPWLHRVAVNLSCNALKKRRVWLEPIESIADYFSSDPGQSPENVFEQSELKGTMREVINTLSLKHRIVVILHYLQDFSLPEISYILDLPVGTIKSRLHHARRELREKLQTTYQTPGEPIYDPAS